MIHTLDPLGEGEYHIATMIALMVDDCLPLKLLLYWVSGDDVLLIVEWISKVSQMKAALSPDWY